MKKRKAEPVQKADAGAGEILPMDCWGEVFSYITNYRELDWAKDYGQLVCKDWKNHLETIHYTGNGHKKIPFGFLCDVYDIKTDGSTYKMPKFIRNVINNSGRKIAVRLVGCRGGCDTIHDLVFSDCCTIDNRTFEHLISIFGDDIAELYVLTISKLSRNGFFSLKVLSKLQVLHINNVEDGFDHSMLKMLADNMHDLRDLSIDHTEFAGEDPYCFSPILDMKQLRKLNVGAITHNGPEFLEKLRALKHLREITVYSGSGTEETNRIFEAVGKVENLEAVTFCGGESYEDGPNAVRHLLPLKNLKKLKLKASPDFITDEGLLCISKFKNLEELHFSSRGEEKITKKGFEYLLQLPNLKILKLDEMIFPMVEGAVGIIARLPKLEILSFHIRGHVFTEEERTQLKNATRLKKLVIKKI